MATQVQVVSGGRDRWYPANIKTTGTFTLKPSSGTLGRVTINNPGTSWILTLYDSLVGSGTLLGTIAVPANYIGPLDYAVIFYVGLTVVSSGTPGDCTVAFE